MHILPPLTTTCVFFFRVEVSRMSGVLIQDELPCIIQFYLQFSLFLDSDTALLCHCCFQWSSLLGSLAGGGGGRGFSLPNLIMMAQRSCFTEI